MNDATLHISEVVHELTIIGGDQPEVLKAIHEPVIEILEVAAQGPRGIQGEQGIQGIQGEQGPQGDPGPGLMAVVDDPDPHLGGDLIMSGYQIKGQAETTDLIIDGGLL